ncbi:hypothetical protein IQ249_12530 [Lusitaniella coriacea LEGE 07157]|uniref:Uncharacterized protein n=1 Tax=Lusitaniella coriacea LEGE 07157 TaxID=945747 RepID=A0A8J7DX37_9CYAN|nr:hypothetical protein [Lusitaniella coriacea]MBE9116727.1 hypothetical protein [Lusitaniella coriacea LEGE 07157]
MRCAISSRAGQVLARGYLYIQKEDDGELRLNFESDRGTLIEGGIIEPDGNMNRASQTLMDRFFETWHMSDLTLTAGPRV